MMKQLISLIALVLVAGAAQAEDKAATAQQSKMGMCNTEAKDKKGDERKAFMKECLSAKPAAAEKAAAATPQQMRMKQCNVDAKGKKGDERKAFMKECLSNKS